MGYALRIVSWNPLEAYSNNILQKRAHGSEEAVSYSYCNVLSSLGATWDP